ncbi:MAG: hypothetical protein ABIH46_01460 [Chloroflexota bacterium]
MSKKENKRAMALRGVDRGEVPVAEAGEVMGWSKPDTLLTYLLKT